MENARQADEENANARRIKQSENAESERKRGKQKNFLRLMPKMEGELKFIV